MDEGPYGTVADSDAAIRKLGGKGPQRQVRNSLYAPEDESALARKKNRSFAAHRPGRGAPGLTVALRPLHHTRN
jgi:hypothetical protein